jgi:hypothetical protein
VFDDLRRGVKNIEFLADPTAGEVRIGTIHALAQIYQQHNGRHVHWDMTCYICNMWTTFDRQPLLFGDAALAA